MPKPLRKPEIDDPFADLVESPENDPFKDLVEAPTPAKPPPVALVLPDLPKPPTAPGLSPSASPRLFPNLPQGRSETMALEALSRLKDIGSGLQTAMSRNQPKTLDERLGGASKAGRAAMELAIPAVGGSVVAGIAARGIPALAGTIADFGGGLALQTGVEEGAKALGAGPGTSAALGDLSAILPFGSGLGKAVEGRLRGRWDAPRREANRLREAAVKAQEEIPQAPGASWAEINGAIQSAKTVEEKAASARAALLKASEGAAERLRGWGSVEPLTPEIPKTPQGHLAPENRQLPPAGPEAVPQVNPEGMIAERAPAAPVPLITDFDVPRFIERATRVTPQPGLKIKRVQDSGSLIEPKGGSRVLEDNIAVEDALFGEPPSAPPLKHDPWAPKPLEKPLGLLDVLNDKELMGGLPPEDRLAVKRQVEDMFYHLGYSREAALAKGLPKDSQYLGPKEFPRGAPSARAWRKLMDVREPLPGEIPTESLSEPQRPGTEQPEGAGSTAPAPTPYDKSSLYALDRPQLEEIVRRANQSDKELENQLFGPEADKYRRLQRTANSTTAPHAKTSAASDEIAAMEERLTKADRDLLYGIVQPERAQYEEAAKEVLNSIKTLDFASSDDLADSLKWAITRVRPTPEADPRAFAQMSFGLREAERLGWNRREIIQKALSAAGKRFSDPADFNFLMESGKREFSKGLDKNASRGVESEPIISTSEVSSGLEEPTLALEGGSSIPPSPPLPSGEEDDIFQALSSTPAKPPELKYQTVPSLPEVPPGHTRLYRVGSLPQGNENLPEWMRGTAADEARGRWWGTSPEEVDWYSKPGQNGPDAPRYYVDVPTEIAESNSVARQSNTVKSFSRRPETEVFLPKEYLSRAVKYQTVPSSSTPPPPRDISALPAPEREAIYSQRETRLQEALPGLKVTRDPGRRSLWVRAPGGAAAEIRVSDSPIPAPDPGVRVTGAYRPRSIDFQPLIQLTDEGINSTGAAPHEAFHWAWDTLLYPRERAALEKAYGSEEGAASAFRLQGDDPNLGVLRSRLSAIREAISPTAPGVMERLARTNRSSIWSRRQMGLIDDPTLTKPTGITIFSKELHAPDLHAFAAELKDRFTSGGNTFGDDPQLWRRIVAPTVNRPLWRHLVTSAGPEISKALEPFHSNALAEGRPTPPEGGWGVIRDALIQSRLDGIRNRFSGYSRQVLGMDDAALAGEWKPGGDLRSVVRSMDKGTDGGYESKAVEAYRSGKADGLRKYLSSLFDGISTQVPNVDLMGKYGLTLEELAGREDFLSGLKVYKEKIEAPARSQHLANDGWISSHLGPLDTWYPLVPLDRHTPAGFLSTARRRDQWFVPENPLNYTSLGKAKAYDPSIQALVDRLSYAEGANRRAELMKGLIDDGFTVEGSGDIHDKLNVRGLETPVRTYALNTRGGYSLAPAGGKSSPRWVAVPEALASKIEHILLTPGAMNKPGIIEDFIDGANGFALLGPFDNRFHIQSVISGIVEGTPWLKTGGKAGNLLSNIPVIKNLAAMKSLAEASMELRTPEGQKTVERMIREGAWNPRVGQVTTDPKLAVEAGLEYQPSPVQRDYWKPELSKLSPEDAKVLEAEGKSKKWAQVKNTVKDKLEGIYGPLAYGPHGIDASVRYSLYKWHLNEYPDAPTKDRVDFVNQIANYNWAMQSEFERNIKRSLSGRAMAQFYTMGSTLVRNGIRMVTGQVPGLPKGDPLKNVMVRAASAGTSGVLAYLGTWALANKETTGNFPWDDNGKGRMGYVRVPKEYLNSHPNFRRVVESISGEPGKGDEYYLPLGWAFTWTHRGMQASGAANAFNAVQQGARDGSQIFWEAFRGPVNAAVHPLTSGAVPQMVSGATGVRPYVPSMYDREGKLTFTNLMERRPPAASAAEAVGIGAMRGLTGANQLSEAIADLGAGTRVILDRPVEIGKMGAEVGNPMLKTLWEVMIPRSAPTKQDVLRQAQETKRVEIGRHRQRAREQAKIRRSKTP